MTTLQAMQPPGPSLSTPSTSLRPCVRLCSRTASRCFALRDEAQHTPPSSDAVATVRAEVARLQAGAKGALPVQVHASQDDLPRALRPKQGRVLGVYDPDAKLVHLVADNLTAGRIAPAVARAVAQTYWHHEQVGHWGLEALYRDMYGPDWERPLQPLSGQRGPFRLRRRNCAALPHATATTWPTWPSDGQQPRNILRT